MQPPPRIDGVLVLEWAWSDVPFGELHYLDGGVAAIIHGLALCRYEGSSQVYRFSCDGEWKCQQDQIYESIAAAKARLPDQYRCAPIYWQRSVKGNRLSSPSEPLAGEEIPDDQIMALARSGNEILAISLFRAKHQVSLFDAKLAVESLLKHAEPGLPADGGA